MHFDKTNFYHHFNRTKKTYSLDEIIFTLEMKGRYKGERFKEKVGVRPLEKEKLI